MSTVETRGITKLFGNVCAVDGVDLKAEEREFLVFLGPEVGQRVGYQIARSRVFRMLSECLNRSGFGN